MTTPQSHINSKKGNQLDVAHFQVHYKATVVLRTIKNTSVTGMEERGQEQILAHSQLLFSKDIRKTQRIKDSLSHKQCWKKCISTEKG